GLVDDHLLRVQLLPGDHFLLGQPLIALEIEARVREVGLVARELPFRLHELRLEGAGIDLGQHIAGVDDLTLREVRLQELAVDAALDRDDVERGDRAERREVDAQIAGADGCDDHRHRARLLSRCTAPGGLGLLLRPGLTTVGDPGAGDDEARETHEDDPDAAAATALPSFRISFAVSMHARLLVVSAIPASRSMSTG